MEYFQYLPIWPFTIIAALIGVLGVIHVNRVNAFRAASGKFVNIFTTELKDIYPVPVNWPQSISIFLKSKFTTLQQAVAEFRKSLPWYKRKSFDAAWFRFYCSTGRDIDKNCQAYDHYMGFISTSIINGKPVTVDTSKTHKQALKDNVDRLLSFAKNR